MADVSGMSTPRDEWTEENSQAYRELATIAVPARAEQMAVLLTLLPFAVQDAFRVIEVGCGEGRLSFALLDSFPNAAITALDGSPSMVAHAAQLLRRFGPRATVIPFSLTGMEWLSHVDAANCVVSSLCLHHLSAEEKQHLFAEVSHRLSERGVFLIADLVEPQRPEARSLFALTWDRIAKAQAIAQTGSQQLFERFVTEQWNYYHFPDPFDRPSPLFEQLTWLKNAGFAFVDCFWMQAGHAIYGGYKSRAAATPQSLPYAAAFHAAQQALHMTLAG
jgi:SAM-dependent methyltransferase